MTGEDHILLGKFTREGSQDAFAALVNRHVNLVYSAALRQVRAPDLAHEISQSVFINLAKNASRLAPNTILTAWLYQVTRHAAIDVIRREAARQAREQIAYQMSALNDSSNTWIEIEPHLDEAMESLDPDDRSALCFVTLKTNPSAKSAKPSAPAKTPRKSASPARSIASATTFPNAKSPSAPLP